MSQHKSVFAREAITHNTTRPAARAGRAARRRGGRTWKASRCASAAASGSSSGALTRSARAWPTSARSVSRVTTGGRSSAAACARRQRLQRPFAASWHAAEPGQARARCVRRQRHPTSSRAGLRGGGTRLRGGGGSGRAAVARAAGVARGQRRADGLHQLARGRHALAHRLRRSAQGGVRAADPNPTPNLSCEPRQVTLP